MTTATTASAAAPQTSSILEHPAVREALGALKTKAGISGSAAVISENFSVSAAQIAKLTKDPGYYNLQGRFVDPTGGMGTHLDQIIGVSPRAMLRFAGIPQFSVSPFATAEYVVELLEFGNPSRKAVSLATGDREKAVEIHSAMWREYLSGGQDAAWSVFDRAVSLLGK